MSRRVRLSALFMLGAIVALAASFPYLVHTSGDRRFVSEMNGFNELRLLGRAMIMDNADGVVAAPNGQYITSFDKLCAYVSTQGHAVSKGAANPFPSLLQGKSYYHRKGPATQPADVLFWSGETHRRAQNAYVQFGITADGSVVDDLHGEFHSNSEIEPP